jgi:very-short-patch-repair endonuclease
MTPFAQSLRTRMTDAERVLWHHLRAHRLDGAKFRRQQPIGPYIVDFVHFGARVIVEADGGHHNESAHDDVRDAWLRAQGFRVLRFWNSEIAHNTPAVLETIWMAVRGDAPSPLPLSREGRGGVPDAFFSGAFDERCTPQGGLDEV